VIGYILYKHFKRRNLGVAWILQYPPFLQHPLSDIFFEVSLHNKAVHREFVAKYCIRTESTLDDARAELKAFLAAHPEFETASHLSESKALE
jgi:hypothetical protein